MRRVDRSDFRLPVVIHTSKIGVLRRPVESAQYASQLYRDALNAAGLRDWMSGVGNPYRNAQAESFMETLKAEGVYIAAYWPLSGNARRLHGGLPARRHLSDPDSSHDAFPGLKRAKPASMRKTRDATALDAVRCVVKTCAVGAVDTRQEARAGVCRSARLKQINSALGPGDIYKNPAM